LGEAVSAFDLDHTLITVNASFRFGVYLYRKGAYPFSTMMKLITDYARYKFLGMSIFDLHQKTFQTLFRGRTMRWVQTEVEEFVENCLTGLLNPPAIVRLRQAQEQRQQVGIFSSSPDFIVAPIARRLRVDYWVASRYQTNKSGRLQNIATIVQGQEKARLLRNWVRSLGLDLSDSIAYSDSIADLAFLRAAGHAIGVNPDKSLRALCQREGWEVI